MEEHSKTACRSPKSTKALPQGDRGDAHTLVEVTQTDTHTPARWLQTLRTERDGEGRRPSGTRTPAPDTWLSSAPDRRARSLPLARFQNNARAALPTSQVAASLRGPRARTRAGLGWLRECARAVGLGSTATGKAAPRSWAGRAARPWGRGRPGPGLRSLLGPPPAGARSGRAGDNSARGARLGVG